MFRFSLHRFLLFYLSKLLLKAGAFGTVLDKVPGLSELAERSRATPPADIMAPAVFILFELLPFVVV